MSASKKQQHFIIQPHFFSHVFFLNGHRDVLTYTALGVIEVVYSEAFGIQEEDARCSCGGIQKKSAFAPSGPGNHHKKQLSIMKFQRYHDNEVFNNPTCNLKM